MKKTHFKKVLSMVLALMCVLSAMVIMPLTISAEDATLVPPTIAGVDGAGTENDPYLIADAEDLGLLIVAARNEDGTGIEAGTVTYVKLTNNIQLPAGTEAQNYTFGATVYGGENETKIAWRIDGDNYTISNMVYPLFGGIGYVEDGVEIKNLKLDGNLTHHNHRYMGMLVGATYGPVTIDNCHSSGTVTTAASDKSVISVAGLVGLAVKYNFAIRNCTNSAAITLNASQVKTDGEAMVGGIVGTIQHYTDAAVINQVIENCTNSGSVSLTNTTTVELAAAGGILGATYASLVRSNIEYTALVKGCSNTATVASTVPNAKVAGIVGLSTVTSATVGDYSFGKLDIVGCTTTGDLPIYNPGIVMETHTFDSTDDCTCNDVGCSYALHEYDNSWDATCNKTCGHTRPFYGTTNDTNAREYDWYTEAGGTEAAPYEIATAADFAGLSAMSYGLHGAERVNFDGKYFKLTADIDMTGYKVDPINMDGATITFDGNGKKIANWAVEGLELGGMFSYLGKGSVVKNLTLDNVDFTVTNTAAAVVANAAVGVNVYNVTVNANSSVTTTGLIAAGIVGAVIDETAETLDEEATVKVTFCVNNAAVTSAQVAGGIVGKIKGDFTYQISHSANKGAIAVNSTKNSSAYYVGGILAWVEAAQEAVDDDTYSYKNTFIQSCYNEGKLSTTNTIAACYVGGIAGCLIAKDGSEISISHCYDISARQPSTTSGSNLKNAGIGAGSTTTLTKFIDYCYAANTADSALPYTDIVTWGKATDSQIDEYSSLVVTVTDEITNANGAASTMQAEMQKIDAAVVALTEIVWDYGDSDDDSTDGDTTNNAGDNTTGGNATNNTTDTTAAPADTTAADEKEKGKGCGSALNSTYAVIALVAVLGFAFVAKKREEN